MAVKNSGEGDGETAVRDKTKRENRFLDRFSRSREVLKFPLWGRVVGVYRRIWRWMVYQASTSVRRKRLFLLPTTKKGSPFLISRSRVTVEMTR